MLNAAMNAANFDPKQTLEMASTARLDSLAEEYSRDWQAPSAEAIVERIQGFGGLRQHALYRLLEVEIYQAYGQGKLLSPAPYLERFSSDRSVVEAAFEEFNSRDHSTLDVSLRDDTAALPGTTAGGSQPRAPRPQPGKPSVAEKRIGRYQIQQILGQGGFGVVYLAEDTQLRRAVALKMPRENRFRSSGEIETFIEEARTAASVKHPGLVAVYDIQTLDDGRPYIVQEYIEGESLADWSRQRHLSVARVAELCGQICAALQALHEQGITHCDLKLGNVLMDQQGKPHVADFGLAQRALKQPLEEGRIVGTPAMMAPEQVRGESHRLDARTDVWALGVMMYELLSGDRPFRGDDLTSLFQHIQQGEPPTLSELRGDIPAGFERICLKCLEKRQVDRYESVQALRRDLLAWASPAETELTAPSRSRQVTVIPKGLRSFDATDNDFFLRLLPGPYDAEGLPESVRFWINKLNSTDPQVAFAIGLLYGPSGCGKSSFIKAGVLPRLESQVRSLYVEASPGVTEERLLGQIKRQFSDLATETSLVNALIRLRTRQMSGHKLVIVIDQFELWLNQPQSDASSELLQALRHCDGEHVQALLMTRDDFYLSANRCFQQLEQNLLEGHNQGVMDLFGRNHAKRVLREFGQAFGTLDSPLSSKQAQFIELAIDQLAEQDRVICVRLALFAEMMKQRRWEPESLKQLGGVEGLGYLFLEETFSQQTAPAARRTHAWAARGVLAALISDADGTVKGTVRTHAELLAAAGYEKQPERFAALLRILDHETRLITPTDAAQTEATPAAPAYQLTHDYLVQPIRTWLLQQQLRTRMGRAQASLSERLRTWRTTRESRFLPNLIEYVKIRLYVPKVRQNAMEREMMAKADRYYALRSLLTLAILLALLGSGVRIWRTQRQAQAAEQQQAIDYVTGLMVCAPATVADAIRQCQSLAERTLPRILQQWQNQQGELNSRLHAAMAVVSMGTPQQQTEARQFLLEQVEQADPAECPNFVFALSSPPGQLALQSALKQAAVDQAWFREARLAILLMESQDTAPLSELLSLPTWREQPARFAAARDTLLAGWYANLAEAQAAIAVGDLSLQLGHTQVNSQYLLERSQLAVEFNRRIDTLSFPSMCEYLRQCNQLATRYLNAREYQRAIDTSQDTLDRFRTWAGRIPDPGAWKRIELEALLQLAMAKFRTGQTRESITLIKQCVEDSRELADREPDWKLFLAKSRIMLADTWRDLSFQASSPEEEQQARQAARAEIDQALQLLRPMSSPSSKLELARVANIAGAMANDHSDYANASKFYQLARQTYEELLGNPQARAEGIQDFVISNLITSLINAAVLEKNYQKLEEALALFTQCAELIQQHQGALFGVSNAQLSLADCFYHRLDILHEQGKYESYPDLLEQMEGAVGQLSGTQQRAMKVRYLTQAARFLKSKGNQLGRVQTLQQAVLESKLLTRGGSMSGQDWSLQLHTQLELARALQDGWINQMDVSEAWTVLTAEARGMIEGLESIDLALEAAKATAEAAQFAYRDPSTHEPLRIPRANWRLMLVRAYLDGILASDVRDSMVVIDRDFAKIAQLPWPPASPDEEMPAGTLGQTPQLAPLLRRWEQIKQELNYVPPPHLPADAATTPNRASR